ncbi:MAG: hypothetical protein AAF702_09270 [Chloroflexota bacterium]
MFRDPGSVEYIRQRNREQFRKLRWKGQRQQLWARICGTSNRLIPLSEVEPVISISSRYDAGIKPVVLNQIIGSYGRSRDFDRYFRPLKGHNQERWQSIATARETCANLPVIELIQIGEHYFVLDGHHRISVAKLLGQKEMEAAVDVWETEGDIEEIVTITIGTNHMIRAINLIKKMIQRVRDYSSGQGFPPNGSGYLLQPR